MRNRPILGVIPARLGSERLPRKPLHTLAGRPLLEWVWRRVSSFEILDHVVITTDAAEIADACRSWGAAVELTSPEHASGTARLGEIVARPEYAEYGVVVNVQGDEPFVRGDQVAEAVAQVARGFDIGTVASPLETVEAWLNPSVVKVVRRADGGALYFSRSPLPHVRDREPTSAELTDGTLLRHIGLYAYRPDVLLRWTSLPDSALERLEKLEQLRTLEAGLSIGVGVVAASEGGVDTAADAARAERRLLEEQQH